VLLAALKPKSAVGILIDCMVDIKLVGIVLLFVERSLSFVIQHCSYIVNTLLVVVEQSHLTQMHKA
jgi:hypothetical protein